MTTTTPHDHETPQGPNEESGIPADTAAVAENVTPAVTESNYVPEWTAPPASYPLETSVGTLAVQETGRHWSRKKVLAGATVAIVAVSGAGIAGYELASGSKGKRPVAVSTLTPGPSTSNTLNPSGSVAPSVSPSAENTPTAIAGIQNKIDKAPDFGNIDLQTILSTDQTVKVPFGQNGESIYLPYLRDPATDPGGFMNSALALMSYYVYSDDTVASNQVASLLGGDTGFMAVLNKEKAYYKTSHPTANDAISLSYPAFWDRVSDPAKFYLTNNDGYGNKGVALQNPNALLYSDVSIAWGMGRDYSWQAPATKNTAIQDPIDNLIIGYAYDEPTGKIVLKSLTIDSKGNPSFNF